jgi:hypothetical protein
VGVRELLEQTTVVVQRSPGFLWKAPSWMLLDRQGVPLAQVTRRQTSFFGKRCAYDVTAPDGTGMWTLEQVSGSKSRFRLVDESTATSLGTVVQENAMFAPQLRLTSGGSRELRLDGGRMGAREWSYVDGARRGYGRLTRHSAGFAAFVAKERTYVVERGELLDDELWPLAVISSICLDIVHDRKASSDGGGVSVGG